MKGERIDGCEVMRDGYKENLRLTEAWYLPQDEKLPRNLQAIDSLNPRIIEDDLDYLE